MSPKSISYKKLNTFEGWLSFNLNRSMIYRGKKFAKDLGMDQKKIYRHAAGVSKPSKLEVIGYAYMFGLEDDLEHIMKLAYPDDDYTVIDNRRKLFIFERKYEEEMERRRWADDEED